VFYPPSVIAAKWLWLYQLNPISNIIENLRRVVLFGQFPDWEALAVSYLVSIVLMTVGYGMFQRGRDEFADVL
jgi:lipopolysaccharide transport system permease protein